MIRSLYTNDQLTKITKYRKFMIYRTYNLLVLVFLYVYMTGTSILIVNQSPIIGLVRFLLFSFVIYIIVVVHDRSFYGLYTPTKLYQEHILEQVNNNKSRHSVLALINTLFLIVLFYFIVSQDVIVVGIFALITFIIQFMFVDLNDLGKIARVAKKLDVDVDDYRLFDNDLFDSLTNEQVFYVYGKREELVAFCALTKNLTKEQFQERLDHEEYILVTMIANQMEQLGK